MQKVLTAAEMREVDRLTTERYGIPSILLMENAAHAVARVITEKLGGSVKGKSILILCGKGNNGGDGAALARTLWQQDADVYLIVVGKIEETKGDAKVNFEFLKKLVEHDQQFVDFWEIEDFSEFHQIIDGFLSRQGIDLVIDAIFGTGLTRPLGVPFSQITDSASKWILHRGKIPVLSVDLPTGLDADRSAMIGSNFNAEYTVAFTAPKLANVLPPASNFNGELIIANIGSPQELIDEQPSQVFVTEPIDVSIWLRRTKFSEDSYKNKRGHTVLIAGSDDYSGAAVLAGNAAMRSGVGLVTVATPRTSTESVASRVLPEVMVKGVAETASGTISESAYEDIGDLLEKADAVAIGCGLSQDESTKRFVQKVIENRRQPMVVDADALNLLAPFTASVSSPHVSKGSSGLPRASIEGEDINSSQETFPLILTPHEGEFLRLLGTDDKDAIKDCVAAVREFSQTHNVILVLKGERVLIGEPGGKVVVNPTGNSGLGKAGNGDTLTGILAGFVTQAAALNIDLFETVVAAVYVAGLAGDIAEKKFGKRVMTASDVRECLVEAFESVEKPN